MSNFKRSASEVEESRSNIPYVTGYRRKVPMSGDKVREVSTVPAVFRSEFELDRMVNAVENPVQSVESRPPKRGF